MPFKAQLNKDFFIENNKIILSNDFYSKNHYKFKKITASRLSGVLGLNQYTSPVKTWCIITGIFQDVMDPILAKAGEKIEPKIRDYVSEITNTKYLAYNPIEVKFDIFKENKIFGGIPDGEPIDDNGNFLYDKGKRLLEIKTSSIDKLAFESKNGGLFLKLDENKLPIIKEKGVKKATWFDENNKLVIPEEYCLQVSLYAYLRNIQKVQLAVTFLTPNDYKNPDDYKVNDHEIYIANIDIELREFKSIIDKAEKWYQEYVINNHHSPILDENDLNWLKKELDI